MGSPASLELLSVEVVETIMKDLDLEDCCNLRLTSSFLSTKGSQNYFKSFYHTKTVHLSSRGQQEGFVQNTAPGRLGCHVRHLTLTLVLPATNDAGIPSENTQQLSKAFRNLRLHSSTRRLYSIALKVEKEGHDPTKRRSGQKDSPWKAIWSAAERLLHATSTALVVSELLIERLDIFGDAVCCSVGCDRLASATSGINLATCLTTLSHLSLSLSDHHNDASDSEADSSRAGTKHAGSICRLLNLCSTLESLDLHWYHLRFGPSALLTKERLFLDQAAGLTQMPNLRHLSLRGLHITQSGFIRFLSNSLLLRSLHLEEVRMESGTFQNVFAQILPQLDHLHFDDLYEAENHIVFDAPGKLHFRSQGGPRTGTHVLTRDGSESRLPINYCIVRGRALSGAVMGWAARRRLKYGPPPL